MFQGIFKSAINDANKNYIFGTGSIPIQIKTAQLATFANSDSKQQGYQVAEVNKLISTMLTGWGADGNKPKSMSDNYLELILSCDNGFVVKKRLQFPHIIAWQNDSTPYNIADIYKEFSIDNWLKADDFENPDITLVVEPTDEILTTSTTTPPEVTTTNSGRFYLYYRNLPVGVNRIHIDFHIKTKTEPIDFDLEVIDGLSWKDAQTILASNEQAKINVLLSSVKDVYKFNGAEGDFEDITMHELSALYQQIISLNPNNKFTHDLYFYIYDESEINTKITELERDVNGKIEDNTQDLSNIKKDLYGRVIDKEIKAVSSTNGKYVNATNGGVITGGSSSSAIAFYPIEKDKTYHVEIPKVGNSATFVFSFADTIMDSGKVPYNLDIIGDSQPLSIDIVAPNFAYLIIDYAYASGMPVVTTKIEENRVFAKLTDIPQAPESKKSLKILYFGNSFTQDSVGYMPFILKGLDANIELTVGIAYTGGANLQRHCANILNQAIGNVSPSNYTYYNKYTNGAEKWISSSNVSAATILADEEWDVVTFQQSSDLAASEFNTYIAPYIYKIEHYLSSYFHTKPIKIGWLLTQSRGNDSETRLSNYNGVALTARKVMELTSSTFLIPYGTAVQNLRSIPSLDALGAGGGMSYDGQHLQEGIGCLAAAYTHTLVCLQLLGIQNRSILGENTRPNESWIIDKAIPLPNWDDSHTVIGITDSNCYLAQMAANLAIKKMFEVTDMSGIDL